MHWSQSRRRPSLTRSECVHSVKQDFGYRLDKTEISFEYLGSLKDVGAFSYKVAAEIEKCLKKFRAREVPLQELFTERMAAVARHDYVEAERLTLSP